MKSKLLYALLLCALTATASLGVTTKKKSLKIVFLGDSITAGYGLSSAQAYPELLAQSLKSEYPNITITNASISGSTSASALSRLRWQLRGNPQILVLALGANDGLRAFDTSVTQKNLQATIDLASKNNIRVLLLGMKALPNYGEDYTQRFTQLFENLVQENPQILYQPFLLEDVAGELSLNQADGIHPNAEGQQRIAKNLEQYLQQAIKQVLTKQNLEGDSATQLVN